MRIVSRNRKISVKRKKIEQPVNKRERFDKKQNRKLRFPRKAEENHLDDSLAIDIDMQLRNCSQIELGDGLIEDYDKPEERDGSPVYSTC